MSKISFRTYIKAINHCLEQGQYEKVISHCKHVLKIYPKHIATYRILGQAFLQNHEFENAADIFERVLAVYPDDIIAQRGMSKIRKEEGNLDAAIWHMERAFEVQPSDKDIQDQMRRLYGQRDGIEPPKIRLTKGALVRMYARGELHSQAILEILDILSDNPHRSDLEVILAQMYFELGKYDDAQAVCLRLLEKLPYCYEANRIVSDILINTQHEKEAIDYIQRLESIDPYARYISVSHPTSEDIPDDTVMIEVLDDDLITKDKSLSGIEEDLNANDQYLAHLEKSEEVGFEKQGIDVGEPLDRGNLEVEKQAEHTPTQLEVESITPADLPDWTILPQAAEQSESETVELAKDKIAFELTEKEEASDLENELSTKYGRYIELPEWFENDERTFSPPELDHDKRTPWQSEYATKEHLEAKNKSVSDELLEDDQANLGVVKADKDIFQVEAQSKYKEDEITSDIESETEINKEETTVLLEGAKEELFSEEQHGDTKPIEYDVPDWMGDTGVDLPGPSIAEVVKEQEIHPVTKATEQVVESEEVQEITSKELLSEEETNLATVEEEAEEEHYPSIHGILPDDSMQEGMGKSSPIMGSVDSDQLTEVMPAPETETDIPRKDTEVKEVDSRESEIEVTTQLEPILVQDIPRNASLPTTKKQITEDRAHEWIEDIDDIPEDVMIVSSKSRSSQSTSSEITPGWVQQIDVHSNLLKNVQKEEKTDSISGKDKGITKEEIKKSLPQKDVEQESTASSEVSLSKKENPLDVGRKALLEGKFDDALEQYNKIISQTKDLDDVIKDLEVGLERNPENINIMQTLGDAYVRNNRLQDALNIYTKAIELLG